MNYRVTLQERVAPSKLGSRLMSLGIVIEGPEGIVLAAESRVTLGVQQPGQPAIQVSYDNATKLFRLAPPHQFVGVVTYGRAVIGQRTAYGFLPEFEASLGGSRLTIADYAQKLETFYMARWNRVSSGRPHTGAPMVFIVAGFDQNEPHGHVYKVKVPTGGGPTILSEKSKFTISFGGQTEMVDRLLRGHDPRIIEEIARQDCIDLALLFFRTTMAAQKLTVGRRGVGGSTDIAVITRREGFRFIQQKALHGEERTGEGHVETELKPT